MINGKILSEVNAPDYAIPECGFGNCKDNIETGDETDPDETTLRSAIRKHTQTL